MEYEPNIRGWEQARASNPEKHWRQGLPVGRLDAAAESLLVHLSDHKTRVMSYGEFEAQYEDSASKVRESFDLVRDIFYGFDPRTRPILWRCLLAQFFLCQAIIDSSKLSHDAGLSEFRPIRMPCKSEIEDLDWRTSENDVSNDAFRKELDVVFSYLQTRLPHLCAPHHSRG